MSAIKSKLKPKRRRVTFSLISPDAKEVILMGDFNQWNPKVHPMKKTKTVAGKKRPFSFPEHMNIALWWMGNGKMIPKTFKRAPTDSALKIILLSFRRNKCSVLDDSTVKTAISTALRIDLQ